MVNHPRDRRTRTSPPETKTQDRNGQDERDQVGGLRLADAFRGVAVETGHDEAGE